MKTRNLFAFAALALSFSLAACDSYEPVVAGSEVQSGDKACRIESFVLNFVNEEGEDATLRGDVYDYDKTIDISYKITELAFLNQATATYTISAGATISPNPATALDYTVAQKFTVTAPDGVTKRTYTTRPVENVIETYLRIVPLASRTATDMGVAEIFGNGKIGVSGDYVVVGTKVFNGKTLASVGDLNVTGITGQVAWLSNDETGRLVGVFTPDGKPGSTPVDIMRWDNGYDQDPTLVVHSNSAYGNYFTVSGNIVEGKGIITALSGGITGSFQCLTFNDGVYSWQSIQTGLPANDGVWAQQVSPCTGDPLGRWFVWDSVGGGSNIYTAESWTFGSTPILTKFAGVLSQGGPDGWGNMTRGGMRSFTFNGEPYGIAFTSNWPSANLTVLNASGESMYNEIIGYGLEAAGYAPVAAYVYNEEERAGYIYAHFAGSQDDLGNKVSDGHAVHVWKVDLAEL